MPSGTSSFNIGDRVSLKVDFYANKEEQGTVFGYSRRTGTPFVVMDRRQGHDGNSLLDRRNPNYLLGWFIEDHFLDLVFPNVSMIIPEPEDEDLI